MAERICSECGTDALVVGDMSMLIRMMVTKFRRGKLDEEYCAKAMDYLTRKVLQGSILRAASPDTETK